MPPRLNILTTGRSLAVRSRPSIASKSPFQLRAVAQRGFADDKPTGPNQDVLGHVSEEAAELGDVTGETKPDLSQGTPVQEILERDQEGKDNAPQVIKDDAADDAAPSAANLSALAQLADIAGVKFGLPELPIPPKANIKHRYDPIVTQVTNLMMRDGKLSVAQRNMSFILNHLRTAPPPSPSPAHPLLPGAPPAHTLPLDPVGYLTLAIDSVAPLLRIRNQKGAAGGGMALQIPVPLGLRQRRRTAVQWILDAADKKKSRGSGKGQFAQKVAEEIIGVIEGRSSAWEKRGIVHKTATGARANLAIMARKRF